MCCIPVGLVYFRLVDQMGVDGRAGGFTLPLFVIVLTGVAATAHHLVERPARRWLREARWPGWRGPAGPQAAEVARTTRI
jgi:peptidoglycan/LPS O-acetylase OafA/YrhL